MKFKVGDRVSVVGADQARHYTCSFYGEKAVVIGMCDEYRVNVRLDKSTYDNLTFHVRQCRPLKKKAPRRVWVEFDYNTDKAVAVADSYTEINNSWEKERKGRLRYLREFIEAPASNRRDKRDGGNDAV